MYPFSHLRKKDTQLPLHIPEIPIQLQFPHPQCPHVATQSELPIRNSHLHPAKSESVLNPRKRKHLEKLRANPIRTHPQIVSNKSRTCDICGEYKASNFR